jgi:two-component system CheB/CheR fusion protein
VPPLLGNLDPLHEAFVQNVAHELRTPLSIIHGYASLLGDGELGRLTPDQLAAIAAIRVNSQRMRQQVELIDILLAVDGGLTDYQPVALGRLAEQLAAERQPEASVRDRRLELVLARDVPLVWGDTIQLYHAAACLLDNALKFSLPGDRVELLLHTIPGWVCLAVADTGPGMPPEDLARLFVTPFYQGDRSNSRRHGGYGLGLTVAGAVASVHGGNVEVASELGVGSRFTLKLPAAMPDMAARAETRTTPMQRILIVDDSKNVAITLQSGLERLPDLEVLVATSGQEALQLAALKPVDLMITDYRMPDMDGLALVKALRQVHPRAAILLLTAYGTPALQSAAADAAIERVLEKPASFVDIRAVTLELLHRPGYDFDGEA